MNLVKVWGVMQRLCYIVTMEALLGCGKGIWQAIIIYYLHGTNSDDDAMLYWAPSVL